MPGATGLSRWGGCASVNVIGAQAQVDAKPARLIVDLDSIRILAFRLPARWPVGLDLGSGPQSGAASAQASPTSQRRSHSCTVPS